MSDSIEARTEQPPELLVFEFPCNERIRSLLRIENLFRRCERFTEGLTPNEHTAALWAFFELTELVGSRGDIKSELLQELERQRARLNQFEGKPGVSSEALAALLHEIQQVFASIADVNTRMGSHVPEHEWLQAVKGRFSIPGGICEFDLPLLHLWLSRPVERRQAMLMGWLATLRPLFDGVSVVLRLLRQSTRFSAQVAKNGYFELPMDGRTIQMIRVSAPKTPEVVAEISANKYVVSVRFRQPNDCMQLKAIETEIPFQLTLCNF
jgi:cell division protein ZapD